MKAYLSLGKASFDKDMGVRPAICTAIVRYCWIRLNMGVRDENRFIKPLELDPGIRESKTLVLDAVRVLFDRSVAKFSSPELGGDAFSNIWLTVNGFKESMSERRASSQWLVAFWEAPWRLTPTQRKACCAVEALTNQTKRKAIGDQSQGGPDRAVEGAKKTLKTIYAR